MSEYRRRRASLALGLTPLIDLVFLLLVFFLLTAHFVEEQSLEIQLPEAESGKNTAASVPEALDIFINAEGRIRFQDEWVSAETLSSRLAEILARTPDRPVRARGDARAPLQPVVKVLDAANRAGARTLDIIATPSPR